MPEAGFSSKTIDLLESVSEWTGKAISWLNFILMITLVYEVICRYAFNRPTVWSFDISYMLGGTAFAIGAAWALKRKNHVRVDIFYSRLSPRGQAVLDIIFSLLFFFPLVLMTFLFSLGAVSFSWATHERIMSGYWNPPIYPLKTVIPVAYGLLLMQGVAELIRSVLRFKGGEG